MSDNWAYIADVKQGSVNSNNLITILYIKLDIALTAPGDTFIIMRRNYFV